MQWLYLIVAIFAEVIGTSALKATEGFTRVGPSVLVVIGYVVAFYFLSLTLRTIPIGAAYAIWSGAGIVIISVIGWAFFKQSIDLAGAIGIALILIGVLVLNVFSKMMVH